jgi:hypothetical protein
MFNVKGLRLNEVRIVEYVAVLKKYEIKNTFGGVVVGLHSFLIAVLYEGEQS